VCIGSTDTRVMRVFSSSWRFTRSASLLTTAVLLCLLGVFLFCWPASGSDVSAASTMAGAPHAAQAANGNGVPIDGNYLAVFADDDEAGDRLPKNAALLRALVFVLFFGLALRWLVVSGCRRRRPEVTSPIRCWFHSMVHLHQRRAVATLLGVFLL
jgi:hypothetical protein